MVRRRMTDSRRVKDRREPLPEPGPCCVCGFLAPMGEEIDGEVIPSCDVHYWTYLVGAARKASPERRAERGA